MYFVTIFGRDKSRRSIRMDASIQTNPRGDKLGRGEILDKIKETCMAIEGSNYFHHSVIELDLE